MHLHRTSRAFPILTGTLGTLAALLLMGDGLPRAVGQEKGSAKHVKCFATAGAIDANGKQTVSITLMIEKKWHLYANPVKCEGFEDLQTLITVKSKVKPVKVGVRYPAGKAHFDAFLKMTYMIYEDKVDIQAVVQRAPGDTGPLSIVATVNACDEKKCLPQSKIPIPVK